MFYHKSELSVGVKVGILILVSLPKCDPWPLVFIAMDSGLYASMHGLVDDECSMPHVCENASMSVNSHNCACLHLLHTLIKKE